MALPVAIPLPLGTTQSKFNSNKFGLLTTVAMPMDTCKIHQPKTSSTASYLSNPPQTPFNGSFQHHPAQNPYNALSLQPVPPSPAPNYPISGARLTKVDSDDKTVGSGTPGQPGEPSNQSTLK